MNTKSHKKTNVLLCSVFGPFAQDDEFGSRLLKPMELCMSQVNRLDGPFLPRYFQRTYSLALIRENCGDNADFTILDFARLERFIQELQNHDYDVVGITGIVSNIVKVSKMCALVREHLPKAVLVVGGHVSNHPRIEELTRADHIVKGDGVAWFRRFLGQDENAPFRHPALYSTFGMRVMGMRMPDRLERTAVLIPSVGCPMGCNFCCTSAMFGGKGKFLNFYKTGDELFAVMDDLEKKLGAQSFTVLDENFLLHRRRALRLLELMEQHGKSWALSVFSSARVLKSFDIEQIVRLGISWVWMGIEGLTNQYKKLAGVDTRILVRELQSHGIKVLGSTIIGLEDHTPENIDEVIAEAVAHDTVAHQFMLYSAGPGTPLYNELLHNGTLRDDDKIDPADAHGQFKFNHVHPHIRDGQETEYLVRAFGEDLRVNGPMLVRMARTMLMGWQRYKNHPDPCIRKRFAEDATRLWVFSAPLLWAAQKWYRSDRPKAESMREFLDELISEFGMKARITASVLGPVFYGRARKEQKRLEEGWTYEPETIYEPAPGLGRIRRSLRRQPSGDVALLGRPPVHSA